MNAYEEGTDAYYRGDDISMNPYDDRDAQFDEWEDGYSDARRKSDKLFWGGVDE